MGRWLKHLTMIYLGTLFGLLVLGGCTSIQAKDMDEALLRMNEQVEALKALGVKGWTFAHIQSHRLGGLEENLAGPLDFDIFVAVEMVPQQEGAQ